MLTELGLQCKALCPLTGPSLTCLLFCTSLVSSGLPVCRVTAVVPAEILWETGHSGASTQGVGPISVPASLGARPPSHLSGEAEPFPHYLLQETEGPRWVSHLNVFL